MFSSFLFVDFILHSMCEKIFIRCSTQNVRPRLLLVGDILCVVPQRLFPYNGNPGSSGVIKGALAIR